MEMHFLAHLVAGAGAPEFSAEPWYNPYGDCIQFLGANEAVYADRVDEIVTLYRAQRDNRAVGFQIKGVRAIIERFGLRGVQIGASARGRELVAVSLLLLAALKEAPQPLTQYRLQAYHELITQIANKEVGVPLESPSQAAV